MKNLLLLTLINLSLITSIEAKEVSKNEPIPITVTPQESAKIINISGKQRMLTQKMTKEALFVAIGIDKDNNIKNLKETMKNFENGLDILLHGDQNLTISKTDDKEIIEQLTKVSALWTLFKLELTKVLENRADAKSFENIAKDNLLLLKSMDDAVDMFTIKSNFYQKNHKLADQINLAGRQRMLTQKMTKELLLVAYDISPEKNRKNTQKSGELFEVTLKNLIDNTSDEKITKQLYKVAEMWAKYRTIIITVNTSKNSLNRLDKLNMPLLKEMDSAVKMYENLAKK